MDLTFSRAADTLRLEHFHGAIIGQPYLPSLVITSPQKSAATIVLDDITPCFKSEIPTGKTFPHLSSVSSRIMLWQRTILGLSLWLIYPRLVISRWDRNCKDLSQQKVFWRHSGRRKCKNPFSTDGNTYSHANSNWINKMWFYFLFLSFIL